MLKKNKKNTKKRNRIRRDVDLMEQLEYYRKPQKRKILDQNRILLGILIFVILIGLLLSPLFEMKHVALNGTTKFSVSEICEEISLSKGDNVIFFGRGKAEKILEKNPYIAHAKISCRLPDSMVINITERKVRGYVPYMGAYLYIDEEGRVLDVQEACTEVLPLVKGLQFDSFTKGQVIPVKNAEALEVLLVYSQMMQKYEILDQVVEMDVSNTENINAFVNQVQIIFGNVKNGETKVRYMAEIIKTIPKEDRGTLDLSELDKPDGMVVFRYLS